MADVNDVQGYATKFDNQKQLLEDSDGLTEADRTAIKRWIAYLRTNDADIESLGTIVGHLNRIRLCAERSTMPLTEFETIDDVNALELLLEDEHGLAESTIRGYKKGIKKFFDWQNSPFAEDITIGAPIQNKHDPADEITEAELDAMLAACAEFDAAARDKAMIAVLRDTGLRIGAVLSLCVGDIDLEPPKATITINEEANVKGAHGERPLTWSRGHVANWLDVHPRPSEDDVALFHKTRRWDADSTAALRQQYASRRVTKIAEAAGIDSERIHAHLFRGTAISEWIRQGASEQKIKHRATLVEDSRVLSRYSMVSDEEMNDEIFADHGIVDDDGEKSPELTQCNQCRTPLRDGARFCPGCAAPLSQQAADRVDEIEDDTFESATNADITNEDLVAEFRRRFKSDAEFRERFLDDNHDSSPS